MFGIWAIRCKVFANRATLTPDKALFIVMAALAFHTPNSVDEYQSNGLLLQDEWHENSSSNNIGKSERLTTGK